MKMRKILAMVMALALTAALAVGGTLAYLTSTKTVTNTFTVGNVQIKLDEAKVDDNGKALVSGERVEGVAADATTKAGNGYHLLPGHTYDKDPMVTVLSGSESSYVKMTVTFTKAAELDAIFAPSGANMTSIFKGYDSTNWISKGNTEDTSANTRTYEFWYKEAVAAPTADVALDALFDQIVVPGSITNAQLATIANMTITVNAYAIQADGFKDAADAWAHF